MTPLRFAVLEERPTVVLDMTSLTMEEFHSLAPALEQAFQEHMAVWRLDGKPCTARNYTTYTNYPLPTPHDHLFFILSYLKTNPLQVTHGLLFDLTQGKTNQWIHVLLAVLCNALRQLGAAPVRSLAALAQRLGVSQTSLQQDAADTVEQASDERVEQASTPLFAMMAPNDASLVPKMLLNRKAVKAARKWSLKSGVRFTTFVFACLLGNLCFNRDTL